MASAMAGGIKAVSPRVEITPRFDNSNVGSPQFRMSKPVKKRGRNNSYFGTPTLEVKGIVKAVINLPQKKKVFKQLRHPAYIDLINRYKN